MEMNLENLIEKLKIEAVEDARKAGDQMKQQAQKEADEILKKARNEAERLENEAGQQAKKFQKNAELAIGQAIRDAKLKLKQDINDFFDKVFKQQIADTLSIDVIKEIILAIIKRWSESSELEIIVNEDEVEPLKKALFKAVKDQAKDGIVFTPSREVQKGFRIGIKGEDVYYDFSDDSVSALLKSFLNPSLNAIMEADNG